MGKRRTLIGAANMAWVLGAAVGAVLFVGGVVSLGIRLTIWSGADSAFVTLALPVGAVLGMVLWSQVLGGVWRARRSYLRRAGTEVSVAVVKSSYKLLHRTNGFDQHRVRLEVEFVHPETGADQKLRKDYVFNDFRKRRAKALQARFPEGASAPMLVRGQSAAFDLGDRPAWADIW